LLVYWVHVNLCYGLVSARIHHRLSMGWATFGFIAMTAAMLGLSLLRTKYWRGWPPWRTRAGRGEVVKAAPPASAA
jgi:hypothetical protein